MCECVVWGIEEGNEVGVRKKRKRKDGGVEFTRCGIYNYCHMFVRFLSL
jgi:hypothetical protein